MHSAHRNTADTSVESIFHRNEKDSEECLQSQICSVVQSYAIVHALF